jgi:fimbrial chaperone protein
VRIALRLSIPVFAAPGGRVDAKIQYRVENMDGVATLTAVNEGTRHDTLRDVTLRSSAGGDLKAVSNASPYILAGATRSWPIAIGKAGALPLPGTTVQMSGVSDKGLISQALMVVSGP